MAKEPTIHAFDAQWVRRIQDAVRRVERMPRNVIPKEQLQRAPQGGTTTSSGGVLIIMIDVDIDPGAEQEDPIIEVPAGPNADERDAVSGYLNTYAFRPKKVRVKVFEDSTLGTGTDTEESEFGTDGIAIGPLLSLMVEADSGTGTGTDIGTGTDTLYVYSERTVYYLDGQTYILGEYDQTDYPDYPENSDWPPPGLPERFLRKRAAGQAKRDSSGRYWIDFATCVKLPAPPLPSGS